MTATRTAAVTGLSVLTLGPVVLALGVWAYLRPEPAGEVAAPQPVGVEVRDGPVAFVVHVVRCGRSDRAMHGQMCEVVVGARNDGNHPVRIPAAAQLLLADTGARHLPAPEEERIPFGTLVPGEAATAALTFDLPADSRPTVVQVHTDPYTEGRAVQVGTPLPLTE